MLGRLLRQYGDHLLPLLTPSPSELAAGVVPVSAALFVLAYAAAARCLGAHKQRMAEEIVSYFPSVFCTYHEPFLGSAAVLATLAPSGGTHPTRSLP